MAKRSDEIDLVYTIRGRDDGSLRRVTQRAQADVTAAQRQAERAAIGLGGSRGGTLSASRGGLQMERDQLAAELRQQRRFQQTARAANQSAAVAERVAAAASGGRMTNFRPALAGASRLFGVAGGGSALTGLYAAEGVAGAFNRARDGDGRDGSTAFDRFKAEVRGLAPFQELGRAYNDMVPEGSPLRIGQNLISRATGSMTIAEERAAMEDERRTEEIIANRQRRIEATRGMASRPAIGRSFFADQRSDMEAGIFERLQAQREAAIENERKRKADADDLRERTQRAARVETEAKFALLTAQASNQSSRLGAAAVANQQIQDLVASGVSPAIAAQLAASGYGAATQRSGVAALATASSLGAGNVGARSSGLGGGDTTVKRSLDDSLKELKEQTRLLKDLATKGGASVTVIESLGVGF